MDQALPPPVLALVDDDPAVLSALAFAFETDRFAVAPFADAEALLAARPANVCCFIIDLKLPGLSGLQLLQRLRGAGELAPAVLITSNPSPITRRQARALGAELEEKPLLGDALRERVAGLVGWPI